MQRHVFVLGTNDRHDIVYTRPDLSLLCSLVRSIYTQRKYQGTCILEGRREKFFFVHRYTPYLLEQTWLIYIARYDDSCTHTHTLPQAAKGYKTTASILRTKQF